MKRFYIIAMLAFACFSSFAKDAKIDRHAVVSRNNPVVTSTDTLSSLSVGNGGFAFTVDATGLQSFPEAYSKGMPLGTQSDWGWHCFPNPEGYKPEDALRLYDFGRGRKEPYSVQIKSPARAVAACDWLRKNPHRLHLGTVGLELGNDPKAVSNVNEKLDMWSGRITSSFTFKGKTYNVSTVCHPTEDMIASRIVSDGRIEVKFRFPYPTGAHSDDACDWSKDNLHSTQLVASTPTSAILKRTLDGTVYYVSLSWKGNAVLRKKQANWFVLDAKGREIEFTCRFSEQKGGEMADYAAVEKASGEYWNGYWSKGAIVDFSACTDPRAKELERRVVLSQYLLAIQDAGDTPPQETGLTYNSWFGKFHLEMILWHQAQFALLGHPELLDRSLSWYAKAEPMAREIAKRQGFEGVRWMKMTDPSAAEAPSSIGSFLIWQQPHLIYLAELLYRANPTKEVLAKYGRLVEETAEFMASFAEYDKAHDRYILRGCIAAQETLPAATTINPPFELSYWHCALKMAQDWRVREGKGRNAHWDDIINKISPLAQNKGLYLAAESEPDTYSNERMISDHPAVLGAAGLFPFNPRQVDAKTMDDTFNWIYKNWLWDTSWGWDFPMMAMSAVRLGHPDKAVNAILMPVRTNTYLINGHNYQDQRLRVYLPGNGGLLMTVAMMCAGWDGSEGVNPGFPKDGKWNVRWEGIKPMP